MFFDRIYYILLFFFFFSSQNFQRGGALAPSMDAPPLLLTCWVSPRPLRLLGFLLPDISERKSAGGEYMMGERGGEGGEPSRANPETFVVALVRNHLAGKGKNEDHWPDIGVIVCYKAIPWHFEFVQLVLLSTCQVVSCRITI